MHTRAGVAVSLAVLLSVAPIRARGSAGLRAPDAPLGALITVNTTADEDVRNATLSLREALLVGTCSGAPFFVGLCNCLTSGEQSQVSGATFAPVACFTPDLGAYAGYNVISGVGGSYADDIAFDPAVAAIDIGSALPVLHFNDGVNGDRGGGARVTLKATAAGYSGLVTDSPYSGSQIRNLVIRNFHKAGIWLEETDGAIVQNVELEGNGTGILVLSDARAQIGGTAGQGNVIISGTNYGASTTIGPATIFFAGEGIHVRPDPSPNALQAPRLLIEGNLIGLKAGGDTALGNAGHGIRILGSGTITIGGSAAAQGNVISANGQDGVNVAGSGATNLTLLNNAIGVNAARTAKRGNAWSGVALLSGASGARVGDFGAGNVIGGNGGAGVYIAASTGNTVYANAIGYAFIGGTPYNLGNGDDGVWLLNGANGNAIGEAGAGRANAIHHNAGDGVRVDASSGNAVDGNAIGLLNRPNAGNGVVLTGGTSNTSVRSNEIFSNALHGVQLFGASTNTVTLNRIGEDASRGNRGAGLAVLGGSNSNVISANTVLGNLSHGVWISASNANALYNNDIGITAGLMTPNGGDGVRLTASASNNAIGAAGLGNAVGGNANDGIAMRGAGTNNNTVRGNVIGLDRVQLNNRGNGASGVAIIGGPTGNVVGGGGAGQGNVIAANIGLAGVLIENSGANFVYANRIGTNAAFQGGYGNAGSGVWLLNGATGNIVGGGGAATANTISGNAAHGVRLSGSGTSNNTVYGNAIGTNVTGTAGLANAGDGVHISGGANRNFIGANTAGYGNVIAGNGGTGISIHDSGTTTNTLANNVIGANAAGTAALANTYGGVLIDLGAAGNVITNNVISGNGNNGVVLSGVSRNGLYANRIGVNTAGTAALGNAANGVWLQNATANVVGGPGVGNVIGGNANDGVKLDADSDANTLQGNVIGLNVAATAVLANGWSGIALIGGAGANTVGGCVPGEGNVIGGNAAGVYISDAGTDDNAILGNVIGTNAAGAAGLGNGTGVAIYYGAQRNLVGYPPFCQPQIISGNGGPGVDLTAGGTISNYILYNRIGTNVSGTGALPNAIGVRMTGGANGNVVEGNLLSGNVFHGVGLYNGGTTSNTIASNGIGVRLNGLSALANGQYGVVIQEAASSNVVTGNLISGNGMHGVYINGAGTRLNQVSANRIGPNSAMTDVVANGLGGVLIAAGATSNTIGGLLQPLGNVIGGNGGPGVTLADAATTGNLVESNGIGAKVEIAPGAFADSPQLAHRPVFDATPGILPNLGAGVLVDGAPLNAVGTLTVAGSSLVQVIAANDGPGIHIRGASGTSVGYSNVVGGDPGAGNGSHGILLENAQNANVFPAQVTYNAGAGIAVTGTSALTNSLWPQLIGYNGGLAIDLGIDGFTPNDPGDTDSGPHRLQNYPRVTAFRGQVVTGTTCASCRVGLYRAIGAPNAPGGGGVQIVSMPTGSSGVWTRTLTLDQLATGIAMKSESGNLGNTSEFGPKFGLRAYVPQAARAANGAW